MIQPIQPPEISLGNPCLLMIYATSHRSKSCPSYVLRHPILFNILPFSCFRPTTNSVSQKAEEGEAKSGHQASFRNHCVSIQIPALLVFRAKSNRSGSAKDKKDRIVLSDFQARICGGRPLLAGFDNWPFIFN